MAEVAVVACAADECVVVTLSGEIDVACAEEVTSALVEAAATEPAPRWLCCDLSAVTFFDSTGLSALVTARQACEARSIQMAVIGATGSVARVLQLTALDTVFGQYPTLDEFAAAVLQRKD